MIQPNFEIKKIERTESSISMTTDFIKKYEHLLPQPISTVTDVTAYARKLVNLGECWCLKKEDETIGFIGGYINNLETKKAFLQLLIVSDKYQNMRGGTLVEYFSNYAKNNGFTEIQLTIDLCNTKALHLYEKIGFAKAKEVHPNPKKQFMILRI